MGTWGTILVSFWYHFGVLGVSFGDLEPPRDPPRRQGGKSNRESDFWVLPWDPFWGPNRQRIEKKSFREARWNALCTKCCTRGVPGYPPTMTTMVSCTRNHRFHMSTGSSKAIENGVQWVRLWDPLGRLGRHFGCLAGSLGQVGILIDSGISPGGPEIKGPCPGEGNGMIPWGDCKQQTVLQATSRKAVRL